MPIEYKVITKLFDYFQEGFLNSSLEFIAEPKANIYFSIENVKTEKDLYKKVIHWFSRPAFKSEPFASKKKNEQLHNMFLNGVNGILGTSFNAEQISLIYAKLGNGVNEHLTEKFIDSGFSLDVLKEKR